jgi:hypothetical protein
VAKREEKKDISKRKQVRWMGRLRKIDQQGRWIMDNLVRGKIHQWMLWSTTQENRKDKLVKP